MRIFDNEGFTPTHILYVPFVLRSPFSHCTTYRHHTIGDSLKWDTEVTYSPSSVLSELYHYLVKMSIGGKPNKFRLSLLEVNTFY